MTNILDRREFAIGGAVLFAGFLVPQVAVNGP